jgi:triacylglycerol lipase
MQRRIFLSLIGLFWAGPSTTHAQPPANREPVRRVILVHGFLDTGSAFKPLRKRLEKRGMECFVPRLKPSDGRGGLEPIAARLKEDIDARYANNEPFSIIAFSMGGLVSRHYLQKLGGARRCENFITISSPHNGTSTAWCYPTSGAKQMRPNSKFLAELAASENSLGTMPVTSYRTPMDLMILPPESSIWPRAENLKVPVLMHPMMLTSRLVLDDIEQRLLK